MGNEYIEFLTPVGRIVQGDAFKPQTKDMDGNLLVYKKGPDEGKPRVSYFIGLAIPKTDPGWPALQQKIDQVGREGHPNAPFESLALKYIDGDSNTPNMNGNIPCEMEGFAGNWILRTNSGFPPELVVCENGVYKEITEPSELQRGFYARIYGTLDANTSRSKPGVYVNLRKVERIGYGSVIKGQEPSADQVFGAAPVTTLPPGASATPLAPPSQAAQPATAGTPIPPPAKDFVAGPTVYNVQGESYTAAQLLGFGWTQAQIDAL